MKVFNSRPNFLSSMHSNFLAVIHGFQENEVLLQIGYLEFTPPSCSHCFIIWQFPITTQRCLVSPLTPIYNQTQRLWVVFLRILFRFRNTYLIDWDRKPNNNNNNNQVPPWRKPCRPIPIYLMKQWSSPCNKQRSNNIMYHAHSCVTSEFLKINAGYSHKSLMHTHNNPVRLLRLYIEQFHHTDRIEANIGQSTNSESYRLHILQAIR